MGNNSWTKSIKGKCSFCDSTFFEINRERHEKTCLLNPINIRLCIVCDTPVKRKGANTCGYSCANKHFRTGPNHGNWKQSAYVTTCFHFHKKKCVVCEEENIVEVHHLDENKNNNDPSNLIPLCPTHHQYWHSRYQDQIKDKVLEYIKEWKLKNTSVELGSD